MPLSWHTTWTGTCPYRRVARAVNVRSYARACQRQHSTPTTLLTDSMRPSMVVGMNSGQQSRKQVAATIREHLNEDHMVLFNVRTPRRGGDDLIRIEWWSTPDEATVAARIAPLIEGQDVVVRTVSRRRIGGVGRT